MPELPDLEVFSKNLSKALAGASLQAVKFRPGAKTHTAKQQYKILEGQRLKKVYREGKELRFAFTKNILGVHLMLHGRLHWVEDKPPTHTLMLLCFEKNRSLALADYQKLAAVSLDPEESPVPDALSGKAGLSFWKKALATRATVKNVLLNQHIVRGIGNAYADEILWAARISPFSIAQQLPPDAVRALSQAVKQVLKKAITQITREQKGIIGGEVRDFLSIHHAGKKLSPGGAVIQHTTTAGRKTYYTHEQRLYK
jgi:formamidopyrimidine-DNA glycosylase